MVDEAAERTQLLTELLALQQSWESSTAPSMLQSLMEIDLTIQQLKVLGILVIADGGSTGHELAETLRVSMATVSGILDRLEAQGMIARTEDTRDRRVRRIHPTPLGRATMQRLIATQPRIDAGPLMTMPLDDLRALAQGMRAILRALEEGRPDVTR